MQRESRITCATSKEVTAKLKWKRRRAWNWRFFSGFEHTGGHSCAPPDNNTTLAVHKYFLEYFSSLDYSCRISIYAFDAIFYVSSPRTESETEPEQANRFRRRRRILCTLKCCFRFFISFNNLFSLSSVFYRPRYSQAHSFCAALNGNKFAYFFRFRHFSDAINHTLFFHNLSHIFKPNFSA